MNSRRQYLGTLTGTLFAVGNGCLAGTGGDDDGDTSTDESESDTTGGDRTTDADSTADGTRDSSSDSALTTDPEGGQEARRRPTLSLSFSYEDVGERNRVSIRHAGGDALDGTRVTVTIGDAVAFEDGGVATSNYREVADEWGENVTTGDELTVEDGKGNPITDGQTVEVAWTPADGDPVLVGMSQVSP